MVARTRNLAGPGLLLGAAGGGALLALGGAALAGGLGEKTTTVHETQGMSPVVRPARWITLWLVTMWPALSTTKPEPSDVTWTTPGADRR